MQWNSTGVTVAGVTSTSGSALTLLNSPIGISVFANDSTIYVADTGNNRIVKWTVGTSSGVLVSVSGGLSKPYGVYVDSVRNVFVSDLGNAQVKFYPSGTTAGTTISTAWTSTLDKPSCTHVRSNTIYVCDNGTNVILRNGSEAAGKGNGATGEIQHSYGLAVDANNTMYIASMDHHVIVKWLPSAASTSAGTVVAGSSLGTAGTSSSLLNTPTSVAQDSQGNLYVVDRGNHRIQLFCQYPTASTTAITIAGTGSAGANSTILSSPTGIALDSALNVYVTDTGNHRVQMFQRIA